MHFDDRLMILRNRSLRASIGLTICNKISFWRVTRLGLQCFPVYPVCKVEKARYTICLIHREMRSSGALSHE